MTGNAPRNAADDIRYGGLAVDDDDWIRAFLDEAPAGVLALPDEAEPHVVTQLFVHDAETDCLFFHGAQGGRAHDLVSAAATTPATFTASELGRVLPAQMPVNFNVEYKSVVARGELSLLSDDAEKFPVLARFMAKYAPQLTAGEDYDPIAEESVARTAVYRFDIHEWTAKHGEKPAEFPGAYEYGEATTDE